VSNQQYKKWNVEKKKHPKQLSVARTR